MGNGGTKLVNTKYNQKLPYFYVMTKCMANNYFFVSRIYRFYDKKVVISHPLFHDIVKWKLLVILVIKI